MCLNSDGKQAPKRRGHLKPGSPDAVGRAILRGSRSGGFRTVREGLQTRRGLAWWLVGLCRVWVLV